MDLLSFLQSPVEVEGTLRGFHAIMTSGDNRLVALILTRGFKQITLFVRQKTETSIEIEAEVSESKTN